MGKFLLLALSIAPSSENLLTFLGISYITGDFNLDLLQSQNNSVTAEFVENLFPFSFFALNKKKLTRTTQYSAILIDDIFTNNTLITVKNGLTVTDISDHFPIYSIFQTNASDLWKTFLSFRDLTHPLGSERYKYKAKRRIQYCLV